MAARWGSNRLLPTDCNNKSQRGKSSELEQLEFLQVLPQFGTCRVQIAGRRRDCPPWERERRGRRQRAGLVEVVRAVSRPLQIGARRPFARPGTLRTPAHWCTNGAPFTHRRVSALPPARTHCTASSAHRPCTQLTRLGEPELASAASVASRPLPNGAPIAPPCTSSLTSYALLCPACERAAGGHGHGPRAASQPRVRQDLRQG